jgi:predicted PurR-regulated permease PerM
VVVPEHTYHFHQNHIETLVEMIMFINHHAPERAMVKEGNNHSSRRVFFGLLTIITLLGLIVIWPLLAAIVTGVILSYVFFPVYRFFERRTHRKAVAAFIVAVIIVLLTTIPIFFMLQALTKETSYLYVRAKQQITSGRLIAERCLEDNLICNFVNGMNTLLADETTRDYITGLFTRFVGFLTEKISAFIISLPRIILNLIIIIFITYYLFKDGPELVKRIKKAVPLHVHHQEEIFKQLGDVVYAVIYGSLVVALVQGTLGAFGFWMFGLKSFVWWGIVMAFFALIPFVGTWLVWLPASGYLMLTGYLEGEIGVLWRGVGLFFYGLLIVSSIDNILKPILVAGKAHVHPALVLVGVLGGLFVFGPIGLVIGPLVLALFQNLLQIYEREQIPHAEEERADILGKRNHQR